MRNKRLPFLILILGPILFLQFSELQPKKNQWFSLPYRIEMSYHYSSQCNPGYCEDEKILDLVANVPNVIFGRSPTPSYTCWFYQKSKGNMWPHFGHSDGDAKIVTVEMCPHLSGGGVEPNKIVNRNNNFDINLMILPKEAAREYLREKYGYKDDSLIPEPLVEEVWMQFQAMTPFSNPAVEYENSDGNGVMNTFTVFFNVPLNKLMNSEEITIQVSEPSECGKGDWSIWFHPMKRK